MIMLISNPFMSVLLFVAAIVVVIATIAIIIGDIEYNYTSTPEIPNQKFVFMKGELVLHVKTNSIYRIVMTPGIDRLEDSNEAFYAYRDLNSGIMWYRKRSSMEDGRFIHKAKHFEKYTLEENNEAVPI